MKEGFLFQYYEWLLDFLCVILVLLAIIRKEFANRVNRTWIVR